MSDCFDRDDLFEEGSEVRVKLRDGQSRTSLHTSGSYDNLNGKTGIIKEVDIYDPTYYVQVMGQTSPKWFYADEITLVNKEEQSEIDKLKAAIWRKAMELLDDEVLCEDIIPALQDLGITNPDGFSEPERGSIVRHPEDSTAFIRNWGGAWKVTDRREGFTWAEVTAMCKGKPVLVYANKDRNGYSD